MFKFVEILKNLDLWTPYNWMKPKIKKKNQIKLSAVWLQILHLNIYLKVSIKN